VSYSVTLEKTVNLHANRSRELTATEVNIACRNSTTD
jgi:hypothetical protein